MIIFDAGLVFFGRPVCTCTVCTLPAVQQQLAFGRNEDDVGVNVHNDILRSSVRVYYVVICCRPSTDILQTCAFITRRKMPSRNSPRPSFRLFFRLTIFALFKRVPGNSAQVLELVTFSKGGADLVIGITRKNVTMMDDFDTFGMLQDLRYL